MNNTPDKELLYLSTILVCGDNSTKLKENRVYSLDVFRKHRDLIVSTSRSKDKEVRTLGISNNRYIVATSVKEVLSGTIALMISYVIGSHPITDIIISEDEYQLFNQDSKKLISRKILSVAILIEALYFRDMATVPLLITEFPNISMYILDGSDPSFK